MIKQDHSHAREVVVADAISPVVAELRLVDVADYIAFIRMERFCAIADLVESAAELYFMPGTLRLGHGGEAQAAWSMPPRIMLDLELHASGAKVFFRLTLEADKAGVDLTYVAFDDPSEDAHSNTMRLQRGLDAARLRAPTSLQKAG